MKNRIQPYKFKSLIILLISQTALFGCKKGSINDEQNFDVKNEIFRVITNSDVRYDVRILEIFPNNSIGDTILNINISGTSEVNYGFMPKKGSRLVVNTSGKNAKILNCTVAYRGQRLGSDNLIIKGNTSYIDFEYAISK